MQQELTDKGPVLAQAQIDTAALMEQVQVLGYLQYIYFHTNIK